MKTQKENLIQLANDVQNDIELVRDKKMNLDQARAIGILCNSVVKANLAAIRMNGEKK